MPRRKRKLPEDDENYDESMDAVTQEDMEAQAIALAMRRAYQQLQDGTASQQVIVHFLRAGSQKQREELEKLKDEKALLQAKIKNLESQEQSERMYRDAIRAFQSYSGNIASNNDEEV